MQVEALSTAISLNVWSPSVDVETLNEVWGESLPLDLTGAWSVPKLLALTAHYIWELAHGLLASPMDTLRDIIHTHYQPLYGASGTGPYSWRKPKTTPAPSTTKPRATTVSASSSGVASPDGTAQLSTPDSVPSSPPSVGAADSNSDSESDEFAVELDSPEGLRFLEYFSRIKKEAPPVISDVTKEHLSDTPAANADHSAAAASSKGTPPTTAQVLSELQNKKDYLSHRRVYLSACTAAQMRQHLDSTTQAALHKQAQHVSSAFKSNRASRGVLEMYFGYYVEDLVAQLVGEDEVFAFLNYCVLGLKGSSLEQ